MTSLTEGFWHCRANQMLQRNSPRESPMHHQDDEVAHEYPPHVVSIASANHAGKYLLLWIKMDCASAAFIGVRLFVCVGPWEVPLNSSQINSLVPHISRFLDSQLEIQLF